MTGKRFYLGSTRGRRRVEPGVPELSSWGATLSAPPPSTVTVAGRPVRPVSRVLHGTLTSFTFTFSPFPVQTEPLASLRHFTLKAFGGSC